MSNSDNNLSKSSTSSSTTTSSFSPSNYLTMVNSTVGRYSLQRMSNNHNERSSTDCCVPVINKTSFSTSPTAGAAASAVPVVARWPMIPYHAGRYIHSPYLISKARSFLCGRGASMMASGNPAASDTAAMLRKPQALYPSNHNLERNGSATKCLDQSGSTNHHLDQTGSVNNKNDHNKYQAAAISSATRFQHYRALNKFHHQQQFFQQQQQHKHHSFAYNKSQLCHQLKQRHTLSYIQRYIASPKLCGKKLFQCPQCRYVTDRKNNLKRHIGTMHQDCGKILECCDVIFPSKASLRDHVMLFHRTGYKCRFCGRNFCRKALLKRHILVHGSGSGSRDFVCNICEFGCNDEEEMDNHRRMHHLKIQHAQKNIFWNLSGVDVYGKSWTESYPEIINKGVGKQIRVLSKRLEETYDDTVNPTEGNINTPCENGTNLSTERDENMEITLDHNKQEKAESILPKRLLANEINCIDDNSNIIKITEKDDLKLESHISLQSSPNRLCTSPYKCPECFRKFPKQPELIAHTDICRKTVPAPNIPLNKNTGEDKNEHDTIQNKPQDFVDTLQLLKIIGLYHENHDICLSKNTTTERCDYMGDFRANLQRYYLGIHYQTRFN